MATESDQSCSQTKRLVNIDPLGDVIFVVEDKVKLLVSSTVLSVSSRVFGAMFGPRFSEGQNNTSAEPKEVRIPEDDAKAF